MSRRPAIRAKGILSENDSHLRLQTSVRLRWVAVAGQLAAVALVYSLYGFPLPLGKCLFVISLSAWLNVFLSIRFPARHRLNTAFATSLLAYDTIQLSALLYLTGGIQNPFVVLLVAPVTVSAATMPLRSTALLGWITFAAATFLVTQSHPLPWYEGLRFELPRDYKLGVLVALLASAVFTALYTWKISKETRQMSAALTATDMVLASEQRLHALDGLAAAAAHELGTPLSTIVLVAKELERELGGDSPHIDDLRLLRSQAQRCREILQKLTRSPDEQDPMHSNITAREMIDEAAEVHRGSAKRIIIRAVPPPDADAAGRREPVGERRPGVIYGVGNLVENAVDFAKSEVVIEARWTRDEVTIAVTDDGPGFSPDLIDSLGEPYVTSRRFDGRAQQGHSGLGLGFFIAKTLLERSGARVLISNREPPNRGAIVEIVWKRTAFEALASAGLLPEQVPAGITV